MIIKPGVNLAGIRPEMIIALLVAAEVYREVADEELVITEVTGGKHGRNSLHYVGLAVDLRTRYFDNVTVLAVHKKIQQKLGSQFDVVLEKTHMHIEFQPE